MKVAPVADVKAHFSAYLERCQDGPVVVTKNGRPVAVLISVVEDDELERLVLAHTQQTGGIRHEEFWESFDTAE